MPGAADPLFHNGRTHGRWTQQEVPDSQLQALYDLLKLGPTSANCSPARLLFLRTQEAKEKLKPALSPGNIDKVMSAPVATIVAYDPKFYDQLPRLFPFADARPWFANDMSLAQETAFRNSSLQAGYLILAARAMGLDCGPMSGFDNAMVDALFLSAYGWKSNLLVMLGHGDAEALPPRAPRLSFDEACVLL
jgi:3-hydroxypropanoate dehydrogenase